MVDADFLALYQKTRDAVYTIARRYLKGTDAALDAAQDVFLKVHDLQKKILHEPDPVAYVCRMAVNRCIDIRRREARYTGLPFGFDRILGGRPRTEEKDEIDFLLSPLSDDQRTAVILKEIVGMSVEETATVCQTDPGTVKSRLSRAREKMRETLERRERHDQRNTR
ncbi:MAG: RNA polymerase sigma factor [Fibrobacterota bacterium]